MLLLGRTNAAYFFFCLLFGRELPLPLFSQSRSSPFCSSTTLWYDDHRNESWFWKKEGLRGCELVGCLRFSLSWVSEEEKKGHTGVLGS